MIEYRKATLDDLERIWNYQIADNPGDARYLRWKKQFISRNVNNEAATFVAVVDGEPVAEVTLDYYASSYSSSNSRPLLADGKTRGYVSALRIRKEYEQQGYVSKMMQFMEASAKKMGFSSLTIGVEATETRNLGIYLHWGYNKYVVSEVEDDILILFYQKNL